MPFAFEQPNLDNPLESHIYFDPGDGRLITVFSNEDRKPIQRRTPTEPGCVHHIAFNVSRASFTEARMRRDDRGIKNTGLRDRQIFEAVYFEDPLGLLIELSAWKFEAPAGFTRTDVLHEAHHLRVAKGRSRDHGIAFRRRDRKPRAALDEEPVWQTARRSTHTRAGECSSVNHPARHFEIVSLLAWRLRYAES